MGDEGDVAETQVLLEEEESKEVQAPAQNDGEEGKEQSSARVSRKRTKTGCLTCRRRRIKCGEERPICANCIKSKRQCEGYNQLFTTHTPFSRVTNSSSSSTTQYNHFTPTQQQSQASLPNILPKPIHDFSIETRHEPPPFSGQLSASIEPDEEARNLQHIPNRQANYPPQPHSYGPPSDGSHAQYAIGQQDVSNIHPITNPAVHYNFNAVGGRPPSASQTEERVESSYVWPEAQNQGFNSSIDQSYNLRQAWDSNSNAAAISHSHAGPWEQHPPRAHTSYNVDSQTFQNDSNGRYYQSYPIEQRPQSTHSSEQPPGLNIVQGQTYHVEQAGQDVANLGHLGFPSQAHSDEELFDVSDDDIESEDHDNQQEGDFEAMHQSHLTNTVGFAVALQASQDSQDRKIRTYHSFIDGYGPEMLTNYHPSSRNSPINDATTARIFCHFINVLGPSISLFERHPANPSLMFQGLPVPKSQQHIWSYTMPTLGLSNPALMHAMLALSSLHIAKLQNAPITSSLRHYHIAIRRVAKCISSPVRRGQPATLAATLLLGFYEVMSADHNKWSSHLLGARHLMKEINFAAIARYIKTRKQLPPRLRRDGLYQPGTASDINYDDVLVESQLSLRDQIDENLVSMITGKKLSYDKFGQIIDESNDGGEQYKSYTQRDLEIYEIQSDLFWWFAKQDTIQSILGGNRLFLDYALWSHCPPRAPFGGRDAVYGSFDHLILLLGRLADFAARDLKRKRKVMQANGGQWRPPPGFQMGGPPGQPKSGGTTNMPMNAPPNAMPTQNPGPGFPGPHPHPLRAGNSDDGMPQQGPPRGPPRGPPQVPPFAGMLPTSGKATLPRGFSPSREDSPQSDEGNVPLDEQTKAAEDEWLEIRSAYTVLGDHFGPDFQPLGPEYSQPIDTPFGPALQYRTYSIAGIWMIYYLGLIVCHRAHPSMPPAATMAAGLTARQTAFFANEICRIAGGISPDVSTAEYVNISVGSCLMESSFALFIAGVQMQNPVQRQWIVQRLLDIERLTGWQTASQVAKGCELSWIKAAENGVGPPYTKSTFSEAMPISKIWQSAGKRIEGMYGDENNLAMVETRRVRLAFGIVGVEEDFDNLDLNRQDGDGR